MSKETDGVPEKEVDQCKEDGAFAVYSKILLSGKGGGAIQQALENLPLLRAANIFDRLALLAKLPKNNLCLLGQEKTLFYFYGCRLQEKAGNLEKAVAYLPHLERIERTVVLESILGALSAGKEGIAITIFSAFQQETEALLLKHIEIKKNFQLLFSLYRRFKMYRKCLFLVDLYTQRLSLREDKDNVLLEEIELGWLFAKCIINVHRSLLNGEAAQFLGATLLSPEMTVPEMEGVVQKNYVLASINTSISRYLKGSRLGVTQEETLDKLLQLGMYKDALRLALLFENATPLLEHLAQRYISSEPMTPQEELEMFREGIELREVPTCFSLLLERYLRQPGIGNLANHKRLCLLFLKGGSPVLPGWLENHLLLTAPDLLCLMYLHAELAQKASLIATRLVLKEIQLLEEGKPLRWFPYKHAVEMTLLGCQKNNNVEEANELTSFFDLYLKRMSERGAHAFLRYMG